MADAPPLSPAARQRLSRLLSRGVVGPAESEPGPSPAPRRDELGTHRAAEAEATTYVAEGVALYRELGGSAEAVAAVWDRSRRGDHAGATDLLNALLTRELIGEAS